MWHMKGVSERVWRRARTRPRRLVYPMLGLILALGAPLGLLVTRAFEDDIDRAWPLPLKLLNPFASGWLLEELYADRSAYLALLIFSATLFVSLGFLLGLQEDRLRQLAVTDPLTGLVNRRYFGARLRHELERARRYDSPLSLLIVDLDWLRAINEGQGHLAGDRAIKAVAATLTGGLRAADVAARYAGDEFAALLPQTSAHEAVGLARRIGQRVSEQAFGPLGSSLSVSIGVADLAASGAQSAEELFRAADEALYRAKAAGRNSVVVASEGTSDLFADHPLEALIS